MNNGPTLSIGATGRDVRRLQRVFVMIKALDPGSITGEFESRTEQVVKDLKQGAGLTVDGIVGPETWQALPADPNAPTLRRGASGNSVIALQKGLKKYGTAATDPGAVDGDIGPKTEAAVRRYQEDRGVSIDGIVGDQTWWAPAGAAGATLASLQSLRRSEASQMRQGTAQAFTVSPFRMRSSLSALLLFWGDVSPM